MLMRLIYRFNQGMECLVDFVRLRLIGPNLLGDIDQIPLLSSLDAAVAAYGEPYEQTEDEKLPNTTRYSFDVQDRHLVEIWIWNSVVHQVLYTSPRGDDSLDLQTVFDAYGSGGEWVAMTEGYRYRSGDDSVRVWCSAMPVIGVGTKEFVHFRESLAADVDDGKD